jgi:hypothetical protein
MIESSNLELAMLVEPGIYSLDPIQQLTFPIQIHILG